MISVLIIWIFILATTITTGSIVLRVSGLVGIVNRDHVPQDLLSMILAGLVFVTVYSQIFSLTGGVGLAADAGLLILSLAGGVVLLRHGFMHTSTDGIPNRIFILTAAVSLIIFLIMAYGTSHGYMHYDTGLYHAQAIHWIEEYGVLPGLANLHVRLGYNSAAFALNALYGFAYVSGRSYHVTAGFCALLLAWECIAHPFVLISRKGGLAGIFAIGKPDTGDRGHKRTARSLGRYMPAVLTRIAGVYYLLIIYDEMVSPASDYYMVTLGFILVIRWVDSVYKDDTDAMCLLSLLACFILTVKLSGALFILLAIIPAVQMIRRKETAIRRTVAGRLAVCIITGAVIIIPYLIRNVIISGWLLYPSCAFTFFHPDWQVPEGLALYDYKEIQVYGRGYTDVNMYGLSFGEWSGHWFKSLGATDKALLAAAVVGICVFVVQLALSVSGMIRRRGEEKSIHSIQENKNANCPYAITVTVVIICFAFWLLTSPLMRYGCLYVYLVCALTWGYILGRVMCSDSLPDSVYRVVSYVFIGMVSLFAVYKTAMWAVETVRLYRPDTWLKQQDYEIFETDEYDIGGVTVYVPVEGDRAGYYAFPSSPVIQDISLRGDDISRGFKPDNH